ncbi:unnamed protein product [Closterium sp. NIES-64]|nr:unnamed protein product [Closterium sp. Naga37s-1]CAI5986619.1 unnamed protein product [Closterium sp. NIES-65]CAI5993857.1 unnamed protein product [Closterium sp. NIES-64]
MANLVLFPGLLVDIVDEEWMSETLPDDDVMLPIGPAPTSEEADDLGNEVPQEDPNKWTDLALDTIQ